MGYKAEGKLHKVFDTEQKSDKFQAREFVIEVADGQYPQMVKFQLVQDKCPLIDDYAEGDQIVVDFDLRGREWNEKYFTNLQAWKIARADGAEGEAGGGGEQAAGTPAPAGTADFDDDIPF